MVVQTAPAVRVAIGEELGLAPGAVSTGQMVAGLKALGFDHVFDTGARHWLEAGHAQAIVTCAEHITTREQEYKGQRHPCCQ